MNESHPPRGINDMNKLLSDFERRITMQEHRKITPTTPIAYVGVAAFGALPPNPQPGDKGMAMDTGLVYTADAGGNWVQTGTIP